MISLGIQDCSGDSCSTTCYREVCADQYVFTFNNTDQVEFESTVFQELRDDQENCDDTNKGPTSPQFPTGSQHDCWKERKALTTDPNVYNCRHGRNAHPHFGAVEHCAVLRDPSKSVEDAKTAAMIGRIAVTAFGAVSEERNNLKIACAYPLLPLLLLPLPSTSPISPLFLPPSPFPQVFATTGLCMCIPAMKSE